MEKDRLEQMIREVMESMVSGDASNVKTEARLDGPKTSKAKLTKDDYPLIEKRPELVKTPTGKSVDELTLEAVLKGEVGTEDLKIRPETLHMQADIAESVNRKAFANNLRRAAELINVPDDTILEIYDALRPNRSSKEDLLAIADELEKKYDCQINAALVREAAEVYEKRDILRREA